MSRRGIDCNSIIWRKSFMFLVTVSFILTFFSGIAYAGESPYDDPVLAKYEGPNGIEIISHHPAWFDQSKLRGVWDELMRNAHFDEIKYLKRVRICKGNYNSNYSGGIVYWSGGKKTYSTDNEIRYFPDYGGGDKYDLASTLAHEYGHHFTIYYLWHKENVDLQTNWQDSGYARIRGLARYDKVSDRAEHSWQPVEIAAEDYVQLFGSVNAKEFATSQPKQRRLMRYNEQPQENMSLPLAAQVTGLHEYWLELAGKPITGINSPPSVPTLVLTNIREKSVWADPFLVFGWNRSLDDSDNQILYTIVAYDSPDDTVGVAVAYIFDGKEGEVYKYREWKGTKYFRVLATDPEGMIVASNLLAVNMDNPEFQSLPKDWLFRDLPAGSWVEGPVSRLVSLNILQGYSDNSFRPGKNITRAEFTVILGKALGIKPVSGVSGFNDTRDHWARDYITAVENSGFMAGYSDNTFLPDKPISRAEAAVVISKALQLEGQYPNGGTTDIQSHWAKEAIMAAMGHNILSGYPDGTFKPDNRLTRAEAAAVLNNVINHDTAER